MCVHVSVHPDADAMSTAKIVLGLKVNLILFHVGAVGQCSVSISQPPYLEVDYTYETVVLQCSFTASQCPGEPTSLWFRFGAHQPESLCNMGCKSDKFTESKNLKEQKVTLTVNNVAPNDSAVYICGIAFPTSGSPSSRRTGKGTLLVVRDTKILSKTVQSLLAAVLALLSAYVIGVGVVFLVLSKTKSKCGRNKVTEDAQKKMSARRIFQEIAQELYAKRHLETSHPPEKEDNYENRSVLSK